jgi:hypothetical protein
MNRRIRGMVEGKREGPEKERKQNYGVWFEEK